MIKIFQEESDETIGLPPIPPEFPPSSRDEHSDALDFDSDTEVTDISDIDENDSPESPAVLVSSASLSKVRVRESCEFLLNRINSRFGRDNDP